MMTDGKRPHEQSALSEISTVQAKLFPELEQSLRGTTATQRHLCERTILSIFDHVHDCVVHDLAFGASPNPGKRS
jgi:hypothetical protein